MSDSDKKASEPAPEKDKAEKVQDAQENPKAHGSEAGGDPGEGRTGTKLGSEDS